MELIGNIYFVESARKLTLIEADISMPTQRNLKWVVFEVTDQDQNVEFALQQDSTGSGSGFQSSGAVGVQLGAGKRYFIGVTAVDGTFAYNSTARTWRWWRASVTPSARWTPP